MALYDPVLTTCYWSESVFFIRTFGDSISHFIHQALFVSRAEVDQVAYLEAGIFIFFDRIFQLFSGICMAFAISHALYIVITQPKPLSNEELNFIQISVAYTVNKLWLIFFFCSTI